MTGPATPDFSGALSLFPANSFVMTARHEQRRSAAIATWAQRCSHEPPMIAVALPRGLLIDPILRDSRSFVLNLIPPREAILLRMLADSGDRAAEALDALELFTLVTGAPCIARAAAWFDCEVARHVDLEADHELFVGQVLAARVNGAHADRPRTIGQCG